MHDVAHTFGVLSVMLLAATLAAELARRLGQPGVLGELVAGVILGVSCLNIISPDDHLIEGLKELGVALLLFAIGLETDLKKLVRVGFASTLVAMVGVILPFIAGYAVCRVFGVNNLASIVIGASLTATSVGITARVLSELGRLQDRESQIVLGAAIIDDILGLIILAIVGTMAGGQEVTAAAIGKTTGLAFGFLFVALIVGRIFVSGIIWFVDRCKGPGVLIALSLSLALGIAWLANQIGSAIIVGSFAAGVVLGGSRRSDDVEHALTPIAQFLVPIFFIAVGASVDLRTLNPFVPAQLPTVIMGVFLLIVAIVTKMAAGWVAPGKGIRRAVVGVGMVPRGEVGLIFAQMGYHSKVTSATGEQVRLLSEAQFSAVTLMIMGTTLLAPPALRYLLPPKPTPKQETEGDFLA